MGTEVGKGLVILADSVARDCGILGGSEAMGCGIPAGSEAESGDIGCMEMASACCLAPETSTSGGQG